MIDPLTQRHSISEEHADGYEITESPTSFYTTLSSWAREPLGYGRCGCVVMALGFAKNGAVMFGRVALKYPHGIDSEGWVLLNERRAMERISKHGGHRNIVKLLDVVPKIEVDGVLRSALILEYVDGWTLADVCRRWARPLWRLMEVITLRWLLQIGRALEFLHQAGVIHKDLKLHNVMVTKNGDTVKLIDFGMSRVTPDGAIVEWESDMAQLGRMVTQLLACQDATIYREFETDSSESGCRKILQNHAAEFWGVKKLRLELLFDGFMPASTFVRVMVPCHVLRLKRQRDLAKRLADHGVDFASELGKYLGSGSSRQLRGHEGTIISRL